MRARSLILYGAGQLGIMLLMRFFMQWVLFFADEGKDTPTVGLAVVFMPNAGMTPAMRWLLLGGGMFVFFVGYTLYAVPYWSLVEDYSEGKVETRTALSNSLGVAVDPRTR